MLKHGLVSFIGAASLFLVMGIFSTPLSYAATLNSTGVNAGPYGPDTCKSGYVWREAVPGDHVCVTPAQRSQVQYDNSQARYRVNPKGGPYGADTCRSGYVWREAVPSDHVCVTPQERSQVAYDNSQANNRYAS
jgi:hypothetical protein